MTRIYLAGAEASTLSDLLEASEVKHILYSFFWISKKKQGRQFAERVQRGIDAGRKYLLDSGAFTYQTQAVAGEFMPLDRYLDQYLRYIEKYGHLFEACAELDIEGAEIPDFGMVDYEEHVIPWREQMVKANPKAKIMPIWHVETRTTEDWDACCRDPRYQYLGIGGQAQLRDDEMVGTFSKLLSKAHRAGKIVHGYAATKVKTQLKQLKFDSVDSSSWLSAQRFGTTYIFKNGQFIVLDKNQKALRRRHRRHFKKMGIDSKALEADKSSELRKAAVIAWRDLGAHLMKQRKRLHDKMEETLPEPGFHPTLPPEAASFSEADESGTPEEPLLEQDEIVTIRCTQLEQELDSTLIKTVAQGLIRDVLGGTSRNKHPSKEVQPIPRELLPDGHPLKQVPIEVPQTVPTSEIPGEQAAGNVDDRTINTTTTTQGTGHDTHDTTQATPSLEPCQIAPAPTQLAPVSHGSQGANGSSGTPEEAALSKMEQPRYVQKVQEGYLALQQVPQLRCEVCSIGEDCPQYDEGSTYCRYQGNLSAFPVRDADNLLAAMEYIVDRNKSRLFKAFMIEDMVEGGMPGDKATSLSETVLNQLERLREQRSEMEGQAVRVSTGGGVLSKIFGVGKGTGAVAVQVNVGTPEDKQVPPVVGTCPGEEVLADELDTEGTIVDAVLGTQEDAEVPPERPDPFADDAEVGG